MSLPPLVPRSEALRRAVTWLAEHGWAPARVEEACRRFDLAPADEEFLLAEGRRMAREHPGGV
jgi:hypothetical protein